MPKFINDTFGETKHYYVAYQASGMYSVKEFKNRAKTTELLLNAEEVIMFKKRMTDNGWYETNYR